MLKSKFIRVGKVKRHHIIRVFDNGNYEHLSEACECEAGFSPAQDELSILEIVEMLKPIF